MRKKYFQRSVTRRYLTKGVAPLIPLIISAVVLISTMAVSLFYTDDQKELRSRAASTTGCDVTLTASALPNSGSVPLNNVDLKANVGGTTTGTIEYQFNCVQGDNTWDKIVSTSVNPYTAVDLCNYSTSGSKTATVNVIRGGCLAFKTVSINVGSTVVTPTKTPTPGGLNPTRTRTPTKTRTPTPGGLNPTRTRRPTKTRSTTPGGLNPTRSRTPSKTRSPTPGGPSPTV